ncbi:transketolase [Capillibacterium thermochitinicola]|uniref:Transketolase n=1 Tax=Capillibacterium thermochitinicola TaxID=2699427 RepID=A0A8J6HYG5_9FIRM|nr:transketolase [Capillibacterium thermochitinicola]MBA2132161.1 transketolase [Capillibacterium thermochitinicola]
MANNGLEIQQLQTKARQIRRDILEMVYRRQSGHLGGSFSIVEMLVALYYKVMRIDPADPGWEGRDRFILSKGHCAPALYAVLADLGYFPKEYLTTSFRCVNGILQGHPDLKKTPGVDMSSGSLGIGLSVACGMAFGGRIKGQDFRVFVVIGDGETNEGQIWEAAKTAAHHRLDKITALIDLNGLQNDGPTAQEMSMEPMAAKWRSFNWHVVEIDGHSFPQILDALNQAEQWAGQPTAILCRTVKGKGVSFMENQIKFHGTPPNDEEYQKALVELL